jgi:ABC-type microcin C transport system permease subunit YejE
MKKDFRFYLFLLLFLFLLFLVVIIIFITFDSPLLCEGDSEKYTGIGKQVGDKVNTAVSGNNVHNNVNNPSINIHNPDINIPSSVGTAIAQGASSIV